MGLKVKLDTNGTNPDMLRHLFKSNLVEAVAMDVKHILNFEHYNSSVGQILSSENFKHILKSIELIEEFEIEHEFRTTIAKGLHTIEQIRSLRNRFKAFYTIQNFKPNVALNKDHHFTAWSNEELAEMNL